MTDKKTLELVFLVPNDGIEYEVLWQISDLEYFSENIENIMAICNLTQSNLFVIYKKSENDVFISMAQNNS